MDKWLLPNWQLMWCCVFVHKMFRLLANPSPGLQTRIWREEWNSWMLLIRPLIARFDSTHKNNIYDRDIIALLTNYFASLTPNKIMYHYPVRLLLASIFFNCSCSFSENIFTTFRVSDLDSKSLNQWKIYVFYSILLFRIDSIYFHYLFVNVMVN